jgi:2-desacetyl-2-hydroxyethyl bacteriochlorophyllide A dehydrogenase
VQGHEFVAVVHAIGPDTDTTLSVGDRVVVEPLISCGVCEACRRGHVHVCRRLRLLGIHENGAFAQFCLAPAAKAIAVPPGLDDTVAVLAEPLAVGVHVCQRAAMEPGVRALVVGAGPIGLIVAMVASTCGADVTISEISDARLVQAQGMGFAVIDAKTDAPAACAAATQGDGFDVVFEVSGAAAGLTLALEAVRVRGSIVQVGFFSKPPQADMFRLTLKELSLLGSRVYTNEDFRRAVRMLAQIQRDGRFRLGSLISERIGLDGIGHAIERMSAGQVTGKILVDPNSQECHDRKS